MPSFTAIMRILGSKFTLVVAAGLKKSPSSSGTRDKSGNQIWKGDLERWVTDQFTHTVPLFTSMAYAVGALLRRPGAAAPQSTLTNHSTAVS
jgi:hypothetical protein